MWTFQRLNSVGEEDSSVKLTFNNLINSTANNPSNPFLFQANMPPVMSLTCNNSRPQYGSQPMCTPFSRAHSFSEVSKSEPYSERIKHNKVKGPSLSFDSCNKMYKPALLTGSLTHKGRQFGSPCYQDGSVMAAVETLQGSGHGLGITAAVAALGMASSKQKVDLSNSVTTPDSWEEYLLDETDSVPSLHKNSHSNVPVSGINKHDGGSKEESQDPVPLASSCSGLNVTFNECDTEMNKYSKPAASDCSDLNMPFNESDTEMSKFSVEESQPQCECVLQASHDISDSSMNDYISSDVEKCEKDVRSTADDNPPQTLKPVSNLSFILSEPRKTAKKGRPSSKKQKKRQREKRKHRSHSVVPEKSETSSSDSWLEQRSDEISSSLTSSLSSSHTNRRNSHEKQSTPVKESTKSCPISRLFFSPSYSEEADDEEDGDNERSTKQSTSKQWKSCISPIKEVCFNFALNLDSIFKQKNIPSLKSLGGENDCSSPQTFCAKKSYRQNSSLSDDESFEDSSVDLCDQSSSSDGATCGFTIGLSFDTLFTQKPCVGSQAAADATDPTCDFTDSLTSGESSHQVSSEVDLTAVNAKWDENYPTAGHRSCQCTTKDEIKHSDIKVRFATEPHLVTVHIVGTEDRAGTWHLYALDRERFERRIQEAEKVVSPVLEAGHRAKILQRSPQK